MEILSATDSNGMRTGCLIEDWVLVALKDPWSQSPSVVSRAVSAAIGYIDERIHTQPEAKVLKYEHLNKDLDFAIYTLFLCQLLRFSPS
jgi:hypothetical protein